MLMIDLNNSGARAAVGELLADGGPVAFGGAAFAEFLSGWTLSPNQLADRRWLLSGGASAGFVYFKTVLHELLPASYDVRRLEALGGRFALRLTGAGDYTVTAINRRVVTLRGLPADASGAPVIDAEMGADVFMAICNERLAVLASAVLQALAAREADASATR